MELAFFECFYGVPFVVDSNVCISFSCMRGRVHVYACVCVYVCVCVCVCVCTLARICDMPCLSFPSYTSPPPTHQTHSLSLSLSFLSLLVFFLFTFKKQQ